MKRIFIAILLLLLTGCGQGNAVGTSSPETEVKETAVDYPFRAEIVERDSQGYGNDLMIGMLSDGRTFWAEELDCVEIMEQFLEETYLPCEDSEFDPDSAVIVSFSESSDYSTEIVMDQNQVIGRRRPGGEIYPGTCYQAVGKTLPYETLKETAEELAEAEKEASSMPELKIEEIETVTVSNAVTNPAELPEELAEEFLTAYQSCTFQRLDEIPDEETRYQLESLRLFIQRKDTPQFEKLVVYEDGVVLAGTGGTPYQLTAGSLPVDHILDEMGLRLNFSKEEETPST